MIPETKANRTVELYRATAFPERWELAHVILEDVIAVDTTIFEHQGRFWLFTSMTIPGGSYNDEVSLFHADSPLGPWTAHPMNPIVSDARRARPAGNLFLENGRIIRPSQDCSRTYGYEIILSRIETLTETEYKDVEIGRIRHDWISKGTGSHTFNRNEDFEALDGRAYLFKWFRRDRGRGPNRRSRR